MSGTLLPTLLLAVGLGLGSSAGLSFESDPSPSPASTGPGMHSQEMPEAPPPPIWRPTEAIELDFAGVSGRLRLLTPNPDVGLPVRFALELEDRSPRTAPEPTWPAAGTTLGEFEVIGVDGAAGEDAWPSWSIRTFAGGMVELPSFIVEWNGIEARTTPRRLDIASVAGLDTAPQAFRDIAQAVEVPLPRPWLVLWIVGAVLAVVAFTVAWLLLRRRRGEERPAPTVPADSWALARLDELAASDLLERRRIHAFYLRLTDITRGFIERRYGIAAPERTTPEAGRELERHPMVDAGHAQFLRRLLRSADMVKFAGDRPSPGEADRDLQLVRDFVREVGPTPSAVDSGEEGEGDTHGARPSDDVLPTDDAPKGTAHGRRRAVKVAVDGLDQLEDGS